MKETNMHSMRMSIPAMEGLKEYLQHIQVGDEIIAATTMIRCVSAEAFRVAEASAETITTQSGVRFRRSDGTMIKRSGTRIVLPAVGRAFLADTAYQASIIELRSQVMSVVSFSADEIAHARKILSRIETTQAQAIAAYRDAGW